ncbi:Mitochondrial 2-oxoadipate and 2-oxoglutarate transporter, partial [Datura stramonium]|nr:Mitochondrial 2-oxoadipate and 2-oxoglutarate transporter [Datura stramonium]
AVIVFGLNPAAILQSTIGGPPPAASAENVYTRKVVSLLRDAPQDFMCKPEPSFLSMLFAMGSNFDCASYVEIEYVLFLEVEPLLRTAQAARLTAYGVSFHIGNGDADSKAYLGAIVAAKGVFAAAARFGMSKMTVLNIGGGFTSDHQFTTASATVRSVLEQHFHDEQELTIIAELGHFFTKTVFALATTIIGKRGKGE